MDAGSSRGPFVQSVDRAITVMEVLSRSGWAGVTEVANELEIHRSTAYRILTTLRERGLVEQDSSTEKYRLGFGLVLLASTVTADLDVLRCARSVSERLSEETQETVTVAVLEGDDAVIVHQDISRNSVLNVDWMGTHTPLHSTAAGKIFLQVMDNEQRRRILKRPLERFTESTIVDPESLVEHVQDIPRTGYAYTIEELEVGLNAIGVPAFYPDGSVAAAVSVSGPAFRLSGDSMPRAAGLLREAAEEISHCLGYRD